MNTKIEFQDWLALTQLYADYASAVDSGNWDLWPEFFTDQCVYRLQPRENHERGFPLATLAFTSKGMLKDRVYGIKETLFHDPYYQRHVVGSPVIRNVADGRIHCDRLDRANRTDLDVGSLPQRLCLARDGKLQCRRRLDQGMDHWHRLCPGTLLAARLEPELREPVDEVLDGLLLAGRSGRTALELIRRQIPGDRRQAPGIDLHLRCGRCGFLLAGFAGQQAREQRQQEQCLDKGLLDA